MAKTGECLRDKPRWSLGGMTALVTGGSKGLGEAVVEELAMLGARVHTCARNETELQESLRKWQEKGFQVTTSVCDVSSRDQRVKLMETVSSLFQGKLNILVNNVGTCISKPALEYTAEDFSFTMATNLESAFHLSQLAHPLLKATGSGSIVLMSSVAGVVHLNLSSFYAASKGAMNQLARNLACEWASDSIRVNSVCPWFIGSYQLLAMPHILVMKSLEKKWRVGHRWDVLEKQTKYHRLWHFFVYLQLLISLVKPFVLMEVSLLMASLTSHRPENVHLAFSLFVLNFQCSLSNKALML